MRAITVTAAALLAAASLAACDSSIDKVSGEAAPVTASPATASPATAAATAGATAPSSAPAKAATTSDAPAEKTNPCPVGNDTLYKALKADAAMSERTASPTGMKNATCADGWATAITIVKNVDPAGVLYRYDAARSAWKPVNLGSGGYCAGYVSAALAKRLGNGC